MKIEVRQFGTNQGLIVNCNRKNVHVKELDENGERVIPLEPKNRFWDKIKEKFSSRVFKLSFISLLVLCIGTGSLIHFLNRDTIENRLYDKFYEPVKDNSLDLFIENSAFNEAKRKYAEGEHTVAWLLLSNLPESWSVTTEKVFYQGLTLMEMNKFQDAVEKFNSVLDNTESTDIHPITNWYIALCYLKLNKLELAKSSLDYLTPGNFKKYKQARKLKQQLDKIH